MLKAASTRSSRRSLPIDLPKLPTHLDDQLRSLQDRAVLNRLHTPAITAVDKTMDKGFPIVYELDNTWEAMKVTKCMSRDVSGSAQMSGKGIMRKTCFLYAQGTETYNEGVLVVPVPTNDKRLRTWTAETGWEVAGGEIAKIVLAEKSTDAWTGVNRRRKKIAVRRSASPNSGVEQDSAIQDVETGQHSECSRIISQPYNEADVHPEDSDPSSIMDETSRYFPKGSAKPDRQISPTVTVNDNVAKHIPDTTTVASRYGEADNQAIPLDADSADRQTASQAASMLSIRSHQPRTRLASMPPTSWVRHTSTSTGQSQTKPRSSSWADQHKEPSPSLGEILLSATNPLLRIRLPALAPVHLRQEPPPFGQVYQHPSGGEGIGNAPDSKSCERSMPKHHERDDTIMSGTAENHAGARTVRYVSQGDELSFKGDRSSHMAGLQRKEKLENTIFEFVDSTEHAKILKSVQQSRTQKASHFYAHARAAFKIPVDQEDTVLQAEVEGMEGELFLVRGDERDYKDLIMKIDMWWEARMEEEPEQNGRRKCSVLVRLL